MRILYNVYYRYMADIAIKKAAVMTALGNLKEYPLTGRKAVLTAVTEYIKEFPSKDKKIDALNEFINIIRTKSVHKVSAATIKRKSEIKSSLNNLIALLEEERREIHLNQGHEVGVIAQEVEAIVPEVVTERKNGYKAVKYEKIVPLLIEAVKELSNRIK